MTPQERFMDIYTSFIKREGSEELLAWLMKSDFFCAPASTKYHCSHAGGLVEHTMNVYDALVDLIGFYKLTEKYSDETIAIVALLHDICKVNFYKKESKNVKEDDGRWVKKDVYVIDEKFPCGHGEKSVIIAQSQIKLNREEIYAIRAHMGGFDTSVKGGDYFIGKIFDKCELALLLHMADLVASNMMEQTA